MLQVMYAKIELKSIKLHAIKRGGRNHEWKLQDY